MSQRLLMIEDDRRLAGMVSEYLGRSGFSVARAEDAEQGLAALRRESFDLVLLDLMLPDADGLDLCRRIRSEAGVAPAIPIVMVTGRGDPADRIVGLELGADDTSPNRSSRASCWRAFAPSCVAVRRPTGATVRRCCASAGSRSTWMRGWPASMGPCVP